MYSRLNLAFRTRVPLSSVLLTSRHSLALSEVEGPALSVAEGSEVVVDPEPGRREGREAVVDPEPGRREEPLVTAPLTPLESALTSHRGEGGWVMQVCTKSLILHGLYYFNLVPILRRNAPTDPHLNQLLSVFINGLFFIVMQNRGAGGMLTSSRARLGVRRLDAALDEERY